MKKCTARLESILWNIAAFSGASLVLAMGFYSICYVAGVPIEQPFLVVLSVSVVCWCAYSFLTKVNAFPEVDGLEDDARIVEEQKAQLHYILRYGSVAVFIILMIAAAAYVYALIIGVSMLRLYGY